MISHLNNHGETDRIAAIDIDHEILRGAFSVLTDAGFQILGSLRSPAGIQGIIRLLIRGSALPEECAQAPLLVRMTFELESYGEQRLTRVCAVEIGDMLPAREFAA